MLYAYRVQWLDVLMFPLILASPEDCRFDKWKRLSEKVAGYFEKSSYPQVHKKMRECGGILRFKLSTEGKFVLRGASFCRNRLCPQCSWRRRLFWQARIGKAFSALVFERPDVKFIFLTLACRNCELNELGDSIKEISSAWRVLTNGVNSPIGKHWPGLGYLRTLEVTRELMKDGRSRCHPHIHACVPVEESYFWDEERYLVQNSEDPEQAKRNYSGRPGWVQLWKEALKIDYLPTAHIKAVKSTDGYVLGKNLREVSKYIVKPSSLVFKSFDEGLNVEFLESMYSQLSGVRMISAGGIVRKYLSRYTKDAVKGEELINVSGESVEGVEEGKEYNFKWFRHPAREKWGFLGTQSFYSAVDSSFEFIRD